MEIGHKKCPPFKGQIELPILLGERVFVLPIIVHLQHLYIGMFGKREKRFFKIAATKVKEE